MKTIPRQDILGEGLMYTIGMGDKEFQHYVYVGEGQIYNKPILRFRSEDGLPLNINPSFHGYTKEEITDGS